MFPASAQLIVKRCTTDPQRFGQFRNISIRALIVVLQNDFFRIGNILFISSGNSKGKIQILFLLLQRLDRDTFGIVR